MWLMLCQNLKLWSGFICYASTTFNCHFIRSSMSIYAIYLIDNQFISPGDFGILLCSSFMASLFAPIFTGLYLDQTDISSHEKYVLGFVLISFLSQLLFTYAVDIRSFKLSLFAQILFGITTSSAMTTQRTIISTKFESHISIATGFSVAVAGIATFLGKFLTAPLVVLLQSYIAAMYFSATVTSILSLSTGLYLWFTNLETSTHHRHLLLKFTKKGSVHGTIHGRSQRRYPAVDQMMKYSTILNADHSLLENDSKVNHDQGMLDRRDNTKDIAINKHHNPLLHFVPHTLQKLTTPQKDNKKSVLFDVTPSHDDSQLQNVAVRSLILFSEGRRKTPVQEFNNYGSFQASPFATPPAKERQQRATATVHGRFHNEVIATFIAITSALFTCFQNIAASIKALPPSFWSIACIHSLYITIFHSVGNFLPHYLVVELNESAIQSGFNSSLTSIMIVILAPAVGMLVDWIGNQLLLCILAGLTTSIALLRLILIEDGSSPVIDMLLISFGQSLIPTISLSCITLLLPHRLYGTAFGVMEVMDNLIDLLGNMCFGLLYDITGGYFASMELAFVFSIMGIFFMVFLKVSLVEFVRPTTRVVMLIS